MPQGLLRGIRGVIFDIDNTLLATNEFVSRNIIKTVNRMNESGLAVNMPSEEKIKEVLAKNSVFEDIFKELFAGEISGQPANEAVLADYRAHALEEKYGPAPGALEAVSWLNRQGILVGLVTNRVKMVEERLAQAGFSLDQFFFICQPVSSELRKPHPRSLDCALEEFKKKNIYPDQLVAFGDHTDDFYPSFYQGIKFVAVLQGLADKEVFSNLGLSAGLIISDLSGFKQAMEKAVEISIYRESLSRSSALDGRHALAVYGLADYFSEYALHKNRVRAEIEHLVCLSEFFDGQVVRAMTVEEKDFLRNLYKNFSWHEAFEVLQYDHLGRKGIGPIEHDAKSCELWIKEKIAGTSLQDLSAFLHLFVTSEDITNFAYKKMLVEAVNDVFIPKLSVISERLRALAVENLGTSVMGRTHLQPASPTTYGKIFSGFLARLTRGLSRLHSLVLFGKMNGAVGNYNSFIAAFPDLDWIGYSRELCRRFGLETELWTDQRGPHADMVQAFQIIQEIGNVARDLAVDLCLYASFGVMHFAKVESHVGSSVMPHKINPWFAEVAEGNIKKANYLINAFANELDVSRLQRDLSDHDLERSYGEAFGYICIALDHLGTALSLLRVNKEEAARELNNHPEILSEAVQTIMRVHGIPDAYEKVKTAFRGVRVDFNGLQTKVEELNLPAEVKDKIFAMLQPESYTGLAEELARQAVAFYDNFRLNAVGRCLEVK